MKNASFASVVAVSFLAGCAAPTVSEEVGSSESKIVGGVEATPGEWDGAVVLQKNGRLACGGTLLADQWVLTAAHCVTASSPTGGISGIVIGRHKLSTTDGVVVTVDRAFRHEGYGSPQRFDNDIALVHLSTPAPKAASRVTLIAPEQLAAIVHGASTTVVGWGTTSSGGSISDVLRKVAVPVIDNATCKALPRYNTVTDNMICAGNLESGGIDSCQGDSGGPLYIKVEDTWAQIGLTSWGIGCAAPRAPGVYTRVGNYLTWIFEKTEGAAGVDPTPPPGAAEL